MIESDRESARRRRRRFLSQGISEEICLRQKLKIRWRDQNQVFLRGWKFQLWCWRRELVFLFGFFPGGDGLAQRAGMFAVKSVRHGFRERLAAEVVCEHCRPRDGLEQRPVPAERRYQRKDNRNFAETDNHDDNIVENLRKSNRKSPREDHQRTRRRISFRHLHGRRAASKSHKSTLKFPSAANRRAESNPHPPGGCNRMKSVCRCSPDPPCRGCRCNGRANPRCRRG